MKKTWKEVKSEVINLGFEKTSVFEKYKSSFFEAFNWAQTYMATTICPIHDKQIVIVDNHNADLSKIENVMVIESVTDLKGNVIKNISLENISTLSDGEYIIRYKKYPEKLNDNNSENYELEIDYGYANILPYLVAYRLWLDDDISKAVMYWNTFDDMRVQIQSNGCEVKVYEGWGI